jgi:hypothetical protein
MHHPFFKSLYPVYSDSDKECNHIPGEEEVYSITGPIHLPFTAQWFYMCLNILKLCSLPTDCICEFHTVLTINSDSFPTGVNRSVLVAETCFL